MVEEEGQSESGSVSEYEEYTDSEDDTGPRLKPVFVPKTDRVTIKEKEELEKEEKAVEVERKKQSGLRKKESLRVSVATSSGCLILLSVCWGGRMIM